MEEIRDIPPNPALSITIEFLDGAHLRWRFNKPWPQMEVFLALGQLGATHNLGIDFELPEEPKLILDLEDFVKLVSGEEVMTESVRIILMDIGWFFMERAIAAAKERERVREMNIGGESDGGPT